MIVRLCDEQMWKDIKMEHEKWLVLPVRWLQWSSLAERRITLQTQCSDWKWTTSMGKKTRGEMRRFLGKLCYIEMNENLFKEQTTKRPQHLPRMTWTEWGLMQRPGGKFWTGTSQRYVAWSYKTASMAGMALWTEHHCGKYFVACRISPIENQTQSINQSIKKSNKRKINRSINQSSIFWINRTIDQSINRSNDSSIICGTKRKWTNLCPRKWNGQTKQFLASKQKIRTLSSREGRSSRNAWDNLQGFAFLRCSFLLGTLQLRITQHTPQK